MTFADALLNVVMVGSAITAVGTAGLLVYVFREDRRERAAARAAAEKEVSYPKKTSASA